MRIARDEPRPATSTLGCANAAIAQTGPAPSSDRLLHCMAAGSIALRCSAGEAYLLSLAKELRDLVTDGDAQWRDWQADRAGVRCARHSGSQAELRSCCDAEMSQ
jgi:hypothetical protein